MREYGTNVAFGIERAALSPSGWVSSGVRVPRALLWAERSQSVGLKSGLRIRLLSNPIAKCGWE